MSRQSGHLIEYPYMPDPEGVRVDLGYVGVVSFACASSCSY
jgi:hypothetical protein